MIRSIDIDYPNIKFYLLDGRTIITPLDFYPTLSAHAFSNLIYRWELIGGGHGIRWKELDYDLSESGIILGSKGR